MPDDIRNLLYLAAAALFIFGIKGLTHPRTAVRGNIMGALGMFIAIIVTLIDQQIMGWGMIAIGLGIGAAIGVALAFLIRMTAMPELVGLFNGFGGLASLLVAGAEMNRYAILLRDQQILDSTPDDSTVPLKALIAIAIAGIIGAVTFSGSLIAVFKLRGFKWVDKLVIPGQKYLNGGLLLLAVTIGFFLCINPAIPSLFWIMALIALILGVFATTAIGGADMPVVVALLNSYSGLAAAATGFVISNTVLIIAGSLVGASGLILTHIMCVAMNRSLTNVLFGVMAAGGERLDADEVYAGKVKATSPDEVAMLLDGVQRVAIVPGYGMAVAQCQHAVRELMNELEKRGVHVDFGIHPVAGRMPGHMNVLLAEADVPYDKLREMDDINNDMPQTDVAIVLGANDVVNPDARTNPNSPIAGMPIINTDLARTVIVVKRSLSPGFAGIPNPLFAADNTLMLFGDGKQMMLELVDAVKEN